MRWTDLIERVGLHGAEAQPAGGDTVLAAGDSNRIAIAVAAIAAHQPNHGGALPWQQDLAKRDEEIAKLRAKL